MKTREIEAEAQKASDFVSNLCMPDKMSKREALDFLEMVASNINGSIDALQEEIGDDE